MQLIVVGMHRSGTSVLARLLNLMGAYFAPEGLGTGANQENPKGFWERRDVRSLNDFVLHGAGCDWNRVSGFDLGSLPESLVAEFEKRAADIVLSMDAYRPWLLKEPRLCLLLPLWRRVLEAPVCIHILRHPVEVASSLRTRNQIPIDAGLALWEHYNQSARTAARGLPCVVVHHRDLMRTPVEAAFHLLEQLESLGARRLTLPTRSEIESFIDPRLYRERADRPELEGYSMAPQVGLFEQWAAGVEPGYVYSGLSPKDKAALAAYESSLPPLVVPAAAVQKKNVEAELRAKVTAGAQEATSLKEQLAHAKTLRDTYDQQLRFVQQELHAQREAHAREATSLQKLLIERDKWMQEKDRALEDARQQFRAQRDAYAARRKAASQETSALQELLLERDRGLQEKDLAMESERARFSGEVSRLKDELQELTDVRDELKEKLRLASEEADARASDLRKRVDTLDEELANALAALRKSEDDVLKQAAVIAETQSSLGLRVADNEVLEAQASERSRELVRLTRLYLDVRRAEERSATTARSMEAAVVEATARLRKLQEEHASLAMSSASEIQALRKRIEDQEQISRRERAESELHGAEILRLDGTLAALLDSASWKLTAPLRQVRALLAGRRPGLARENKSRLDLLRTSPWFDAEWYVREHGALIQDGLGPEAHYLLRGAAEGLNPSDRFDTSHYLAANPDVLASGQNPLVHFILHGQAEGRSPVPRGPQT